MKRSQDIQVLKENCLSRAFLKLKRYHLRHRLFSGAWSPPLTREVLMRPPVAAVLPYDPILDTVVLVEQFRIGAFMGDADNPWLIEIVAGISDKKDENLHVLASRELQEETGLEAKHLQLIYTYWVSAGMSSESVHLFYAEVDSTKAREFCGLKSENEDIKVHAISASEAFNWMKKGILNNAMSIIALQWLQHNRAQLRSK